MHMPVSLVCVVLCVVLVGKQQSAHMVPVWVQTLCFQSQMCQGFRLLLPVTVWHHSPVDPRVSGVRRGPLPTPVTSVFSWLLSHGHKQPSALA